MWRLRDVSRIFFRFLLRLFSLPTEQPGKTASHPGARLLRGRNRGARRRTRPAARSAASCFGAAGVLGPLFFACGPVLGVSILVERRFAVAFAAKPGFERMTFTGLDQREGAVAPFDLVPFALVPALKRLLLPDVFGLAILVLAALFPLAQGLHACNAS